MTLNVVGQISLGGSTAGQSIALELGLAATSPISLGDAAVKTLGGFTSSSNVDMNSFRGRSNRVNLASALTFYTNTTQYVINIGTLSGYVAGKSDVTITVNSGVYVYSTDINSAALTIQGASTGDTITLVNYGYIIGRGGSSKGDYYGLATAENGGPAVYSACPLIVSNYGYIAGGGGAGGAYGGGGAGGGDASSTQNNPVVAVGAYGGGPGQAGADAIAQTGNLCAGGGGGRILPGVGGAAATGSLSARGGGSGGGGGYAVYKPSGSLGVWTHISAGGGGGWGASGGIGYSGGYPTNAAGYAGAGGSANNPGGDGSIPSLDHTWAGGVGGPAFKKNYYSLTVSGSGIVYGATVD